MKICPSRKLKSSTDQLGTKKKPTQVCVSTPKRLLSAVPEDMTLNTSRRREEHNRQDRSFQYMNYWKNKNHSEWTLHIWQQYYLQAYILLHNGNVKVRLEYWTLNEMERRGGEPWITWPVHNWNQQSQFQIHCVLCGLCNIKGKIYEQPTIETSGLLFLKISLVWCHLLWIFTPIATQTM